MDFCPYCRDLVEAWATLREYDGKFYRVYCTRCCGLIRVVMMPMERKLKFCHKCQRVVLTEACLCPYCGAELVEVGGEE